MAKKCRRKRWRTSLLRLAGGRGSGPRSTARPRRTGSPPRSMLVRCSRRPSFKRIEPVAANALATLNALAPGRVVFGISTGYTGRRTMGLGPVPLARLEKYVEVVEGLLNGKTVEWSEEGGPHKIRFLNPDLRLI